AEVTAVDIPYDNYPFLVVLTAPSVLDSTIDINPNTLNLKSKGRWITAHVTLSNISGLNKEHIGWALLSPAEDSNAALQPEKWSVEYEGDSNAPSTITFKFNGDQVRSWYTAPQETATILLCGGLTDGTTFEGTDTIKVIDLTMPCFGVNRVKVGAKDERCKGIELLEVTSMAGGEQLVGIYLPEEGKDKLKANTVVDDGVNGPVTIHTSCSQPIEVGDTFGAYTVTDLVKIFDNVLDSRGDKVEMKGTFSPAMPIDLAVDDGVNGPVTIHTSCSQPIEVGDTFGAY
ncbi:unnamed protein product, partial [marine sediment metagenome]